MGLDFQPTYVDSLILAQNLLPDLGKYKLDIVADRLELPNFNHHRASDDAATVGYMLIPFWKMLHELNHRGLTIVVSTPYMDEAEYASRIGFLDGGRLVDVGTRPALLGRFGRPLVAGAARQVAPPAVRVLVRHSEQLHAVAQRLDDDS